MGLPSLIVATSSIAAANCFASCFSLALIEKREILNPVLPKGENATTGTNRNANEIKTFIFYSLSFLNPCKVMTMILHHSHHHRTRQNQIDISISNLRFPAK